MVNESNGYKTRKPKRRLVPLQNRQHAILSPTYSGTEMKMGREGREEERMKGEGSEENGNVGWETRRRRQKSRGTGREGGVRKVEGDGEPKEWKSDMIVEMNMLSVLDEMLVKVLQT